MSCVTGALRWITSGNAGFPSSQGWASLKHENALPVDRSALREQWPDAVGHTVDARFDGFPAEVDHADHGAGTLAAPE